MTVKKSTTELVTANPLTDMVERATEDRKILSSYISTHMVKGVDYAPIHINKSCANKYTCTNKYHFSKDNLTKAGAEKIKDLLHLYPDFKRDTDTWEMAGSKPGLFCYRCILLTEDQKPAGVGLGACDVSEKMGNMNNAIKIAKKRAFVDAILTTGSLSDFFTQDLEDMHLDDDKPVKTQYEIAREQQKKQEVANVEPVTEEEYNAVIEDFESERLNNEVEIVEAKTPITSEQKIELMKLLPQKGKDFTDLKKALTAFKVDAHTKLTSKQAEALLAKLKSLPDKTDTTGEKKDAEEVDLDEIHEALQNRGI